MYTPDIAALTAAVGTGMTIIGLICRYIYRKRKKAKRYLEITNLVYKRT